MNLPKNAKVRPTTDKIRAAIFSIIGQDIKNSKVLDLFAGSGALGLEALSRGASSCTFVDINVKILLENIKIADSQQIIVKKGNVFKTLNKLSDKFDFIFADPPYGQYNSVDFFNTIDKTLLADNGIIIYEESSRTEIAGNISFFECYDKRNYGDTNIYFWRKKL